MSAWKNSYAIRSCCPPKTSRRMQVWLRPLKKSNRATVALSRCKRIGNAEKRDRYTPPRRRGVDAPSIKWIRSEIGAHGAKREPDRAKPQLVVSSGKLFPPEDFAELTTIKASRPS